MHIADTQSQAYINYLRFTLIPDLIRFETTHSFEYTIHAGKNNKNHIWNGTERPHSKNITFLGCGVLWEHNSLHICHLIIAMFVVHVSRCTTTNSFKEHKFTSNNYNALVCVDDEYIVYMRFNYANPLHFPHFPHNNNPGFITKYYSQRARTKYCVCKQYALVLFYVLLWLNRARTLLKFAVRC